MSYSFTVQAATKADAKTAVAAEFDNRASPSALEQACGDPGARA